VEPTPGYGIGCCVSLVIFGIILSRFLGPGHWIGIPWYHGGGPGAYIDDEMYYDDVTPNPSWWRKKRKPKIPEPTAPRPYDSEEGFRDEKLDTLIETGELREAREYLAGMIQISVEMKNKQLEANYRGYEKKIIEASMNGDRLADNDNEFDVDDSWNI
jgi:hypothetical protein